MLPAIHKLCEESSFKAKHFILLFLTENLFPLIAFFFKFGISFRNITINHFFFWKLKVTGSQLHPQKLEIRFAFDTSLSNILLFFFQKWNFFSNKWHHLYHIKSAQKKFINFVTANQFTPTTNDIYRIQLATFNIKGGFVSSVFSLSTYNIPLNLNHRTLFK